MDQLYLILHKVRGEAAFDIASRVTIGSEEGWIIPTSGHRAYPWRHWRLEDLTDTSDINSNGVHDQPWTHDHEIPATWPDHYQAATLSPHSSRGRGNNPSTDILDLFGGDL